MRGTLTGSAALLMMLFAAAPALCADPDHVGLTIGYPASIGVILPVTDWLSVRPDVSISHSSGEVPSIRTYDGLDPTALLALLGSTSPFGVTDLLSPFSLPNATSFSSPVASWNTAVGVSGLFYMGGWDDLRTYLSPRVAYSRSTSSSSSTFTASEVDTSSYQTSGSFGARYTLGRHFGVFGEVGLSYTRTTSTSSLSVPNLRVALTPFRDEVRAHSVSSRSGIGVIVYF